MQVILDFDCTLSEGMVYDNLGNGNVARAKQMTDLWWVSQFGGNARLCMLEEFLGRLEDMGVTASICSHNNNEVIIEALRRTNLAIFFASDDDACRIIGSPGVDKANRLREHINCADARTEDMMFVDDSAGNCNSVARDVPGLKVHKCNPTGLTKQDCDLIVQYFDHRLHETIGSAESFMPNVIDDGNMLNVTYDGSEVNYATACSPRSRVLQSPSPGSRTVSECSLNSMQKTSHFQGVSACAASREYNSLSAPSRMRSGSTYDPVAMLSPRTCKVSAPRHDSNKMPPMSSIQTLQRRQGHGRIGAISFANSDRRSSAGSGTSCECSPGAKIVNAKSASGVTSCECPPEARVVNANARQMSPDSSHLRPTTPSRGAPQVVFRNRAHLARDAPARQQSISSLAHHPDLSSTRNPNARVARPARIISQQVSSASTPKEPSSLGAPLVSHPPLVPQMTISKFAKTALATATWTDSVTSSEPSTKTSKLGGA